jgi:hypothetical protein
MKKAATKKEATKKEAADKEPAHVSEKAAAPDPYKKKVAEVRRDLNILIAKLRTHGIHLDLDPKEHEEV